MAISARRANIDDVPVVRSIMGDTGLHAWERKYGEVNFCELVEKSYLSIAIEEEEEGVVGFASFSDSPELSQNGEIPGRVWERWLAETCDMTKTPGLLPHNTLWLSLLIGKAQYTDAVQDHVFNTIATTLQDLEYVLFAVPTSTGLFPPLLSLFKRLPGKVSSSLSVFYCTREDILQDLVIRKGLVEDFDDLMPLLQAGDGVLTSPPEEFFLDETLEDQDVNHSVLVAEDPDTRQIVGLMCMVKSSENQSYTTKHYNTDVYNKLRHTDRDRVGQNSFQITFFYLNPEYESRAASFIKPAFAQFENVEYCLITLPHTTTEHPLLHDFAYLPLKQGLTLPNGTWLLCRHSILPIVVSNTEENDIEEIKGMLEAQVDYSADTCSRFVELAITTTETDPMEGDAEAEQGMLLSYCLHDYEGTVVGMCNVRVLTNGEVHHLRANFELDHLVNFVPDGKPNYTATDINPDAEDTRHELSAKMPSLLVTHFYVKPTFRNRIRVFIREIMRQSCTQLLFYCLTPIDEASQSLLAELILSMPRRMIEESGEDETPLVDDNEELVCLHFMSKKQLSDEKTKIYSRLVVIGASTTGLAAIYAWLKIPYLYIANIVLVSRDGILPHPNTQDSEHWSVDTLTWLEREYILFKIGGKVRIIEGTMIDFERNDKYIVTDNGFVEPYDHLIVTAGRQFTIPKELATKNLAKNGMFELSSVSQIHKIKQHIRESEAYEDELSNAVVYGSSMEVYSVATSLTQIGLSASRLVLVLPQEGSDEISVFGDSEIDNRVDKLMESQGAKTYKGHVLDRMEYDEDHNLNAVYLLSQETNDEKKKNKITEIPATMFIYCHEKDIDSQILSALNKRSIVFDGRVIVKYNYRTTDPSIYAVGPIAMFSGRFGPSEEFESFNPLEVGTRFAETVLGFVGVEEFHEDDDEEDTTGDGAPDAQSEVSKQAMAPKALPEYTEKVSTKVHLPNNYYFFRCKTAKYSEVSAQCMDLTSNNNRGDSYIKLSIGPNKYIECITYLGSEEIEMHNLMALVGLPESMVNVVYAYEQGKNSRGATLDLLQYLRSRWAYAVYHSAFASFFSSLREKLKEHDETKRLRSVIAKYIEQSGASEIDASSRNQLLESVTKENSATRRLIEQEVIKFLHTNKQYFPKIYYLPDMSEFIPSCF
eukprot:TRINITY_DN9915_c0_g3_i1.p1 TRINITY_DN9915_c0_g3~~TRINITY_DN9915_c0_g3_i1.p1  ORF type:complete len:1159 (+),score=272.32 TRINITY_DN9915_c0_g3_i1:41-3517(+)